MRFKQALCFVLLPLALLATAGAARAEIGLAPNRACKLLHGWNFQATPYAKLGDWYVCEAAKSLTGGKLPNTLNYQVVGAKNQVQELRLELCVDEPRKQGRAKGLLSEAAMHLALKLGAPEPPHGLEEAIRRGSEGRWTTGKAIITLVRHPVPDPPRAYRLIITAR